MNEMNQIVASAPAEHELIELGVPQTDPRREFAIDCEAHANWLIRKIVSARQYAEHVKHWAEQEQRRAAREEQCLLFLFGRQIETWVRDQIEKLNGRRKSLSLPSG